MLGYSPAQGDLAYPERLIMMKDVKAHSSEENMTNNKIGENVLVKKSVNSQSSAIDLHCLWYPTVGRTVMCLSKLYKCLEVI